MGCAPVRSNTSDFGISLVRLKLMRARMPLRLNDPISACDTGARSPAAGRLCLVMPWHSDVCEHDQVWPIRANLHQFAVVGG